MMRKCSSAKARTLALIFLLGAALRPAAAQEAQQTKQPQAAPGGQQPCAQPSYSPAEYNSYQATTTIANPQERIKALDEFVARFPSSQILPYAYGAYLDLYQKVKNYPKVIEYADKLLALPECVQVQQVQRPPVQTALARCQLFEFAFNPKAADAKDQLTKTHEACLNGLKLLDKLTKPDNMAEAQFDEQKKLAAALFYGAAGYASLQLKDFNAAADSYKSAVADNPKDAVGYYRLGLALLGENPPQTLDGMWALARAIALKIPSEDKVRDYLRNRMLQYQAPGCDSLIDPQTNEMIQLAANSPDRPASYTLASAADLDKERQSSNILTVLSGLQAGGDKAKLTWLAVCGAEFPAVGGKIIEVTPGTDSSVQFKVATGATNEEIEKATTANMEVAVPGQPEAARLKKDGEIQFSGTLVRYDPEPFMLHWDKCKVDPSFIPEEKGKKRTKVPPRKPAKSQ